MKILISVWISVCAANLHGAPPGPEMADHGAGQSRRPIDDRFSDWPDQTLFDTTKVRGAFAPVTERETGFVIGGVNRSALISRLTRLNGVSIAELERRMRPGGDSTSGFLAENESLLNVLRADNDFVRGRGLTHQTIAQQLRVLKAIVNSLERFAKFEFPVRVRYHGVPFELSKICTKGWQDSPFGGLHERGGGLTNDTSTGSCNFTFKNMQNNKEIRFGELLIPMIERYGFYEGDVPYRLDPAKILDVLTFINRDFNAD